ncbi:putative DUF4451 domain-containing protein [Hamiltosporidium magnivora]|uniref:Putative DUF4451 domain-containing protein n=1 Tax=Hamiltosporidium magnivora TaxID=148818 RepID=A0A4Q9L2J4_9MICR|nr:putative DUF4451 domain-containing protein [Hamiltosporidium magnivora]
MKNTNYIYLDDFINLEFRNLDSSFNSLELESTDDIFHFQEYLLDKKTINEYYHSAIQSLNNEVFLPTIDTSVFKETSKSVVNDTNKSDKKNYSPKFVRGNGIMREGYCEECDKWFRLKTSSYWYHMNYKHGVNSSGQKYPHPNIQNNCGYYEALCESCQKWVYLGKKNNNKSINFCWFKHWQKDHDKQM